MPRTAPPQFLTKFEMTDELLAEIERAVGDQRQSQNEIALPASAPHPYTSGYHLRSGSPSAPKDPNVERIGRSSDRAPAILRLVNKDELESHRQHERVLRPAIVNSRHTAQYSRDSPPALRRPSNAANPEPRSNLSLTSQTPPLQAIAWTPDRSLPIQEDESEDEFRRWPSKNGPGAHESWKNNEQGVSEHNLRRPPPESPTPSPDLRPEGNSQRYDMNHTHGPHGGRESRAGHPGEHGKPLFGKDQSPPARYVGRYSGEEEGGYKTRSPTAGLPGTPHDTFYHQQARVKTTNGSTDGLGMRNLDPSAFEQMHLDNGKSRKEWPQSAGKEDINLDALSSTTSSSEAGDVLDVEIVRLVLSAIRKVMEDLKADTSHILPAAAQLHKIFDLVFSIKGSCKTLLKCRGDDAKIVLNSLQWLLDHPQSNSTQRSRLLSALLHLSRKSGLYPECIILKDIVREDDCAVASGHFGEIWKGKFRQPPTHSLRRG